MQRVVRFGLVALVSSCLCWALGVWLTGWTTGTDPLTTPVPVARAYLPLVTCESAPPEPRAVQVITLPVESVVALSSWGPDHAAAYAPDGSGVFGDAGDWISTGVAPNDYGGTYLARSYLEVSVPAFEGRILSATLHLVPCTAHDTLYPPLPPATVTLHTGTWQGTLAAVRACGPLGGMAP